MKKVLAAILTLVLTASLFAGSAISVSADEEPVTLKMIMIHVIGNLDDADAVEAAINEYIQPKINATVDIEWVDLGEFADQISVRLISGEAIDILPCFGTQLASFVSQEALSPLDDLIAEYGQGIVEAVGEEYMKAGQVNGIQYYIPTMAAFANQPALIYRTDIVEELGIDMSGVTKLEDLTPIFEQVYAAHPELKMMCSNTVVETQLREWYWDGLGDEYGVLADPLNSTEVINLFETDEYMELCKLMYDWNQKGYIQTEAAANTESLSDLLKTGLYFGTIGKDYPGNVEEKFNVMSTGYPFATIALGDPISTTNRVTDNVMTIPITAKNPEKAMEFLELLYTDATLQNYICYGIEGQDYRVVDGVADYMEGEMIFTAKYVSKYYVGNHLIAYNSAEEPAGIHETLIAWNESAPKSLALGFSYDSIDVSNELVALATVSAKYRGGLELGSLDPETTMPKFLDELKAAGIDTVIQTKQEQLDAWLAAQ